MKEKMGKTGRGDLTGGGGGRSASKERGGEGGKLYKGC